MGKLRQKQLMAYPKGELSQNSSCNDMRTYPGRSKSLTHSVEEKLLFFLLACRKAEK